MPSEGTLSFEYLANLYPIFQSTTLFNCQIYCVIKYLYNTKNKQKNESLLGIILAQDDIIRANGRKTGQVQIPYLLDSEQWFSWYDAA